MSGEVCELLYRLMNYFKMKEEVRTYAQELKLIKVRRKVRQTSL